MIIQLQKRVSAIFSEGFYALCSGWGSGVGTCRIATFFYHKSHIDWPRIEPGYLGEKPGTSRLSHCKANFVLRRQGVVNHLGLYTYILIYLRVFPYVICNK